MHGFAVVAQSLLRESFGIANCLCALCPRVSITVKSHAFDAKLTAPRSELGGDGQCLGRLH